METSRIIREVDIAPTCAVLGGVRFPVNCEGAPAYQIFDQEDVYKRQIQTHDLLPNSDISEMFLIISYALYIALYEMCIRDRRRAYRKPKCWI